MFKSYLLLVFSASFWLSSVCVIFTSDESTIPAAEFVTHNNGTTEIVQSYNESTKRLFHEDILPEEVPICHLNQYKKLNLESDSAWISNVLSDKLKNFRPRSNANLECNRQSDLYEQNLRALTQWAVQMKDASAKSVFGLLYGQTYQMGNFDECMAIQTESITGRFCLATIKFAPSYELYPNFYENPLNELSVPDDSNVWESIKSSGHPARWQRDKLEWALCVPAACTWNDVEESLVQTVADLPKKHNIFINVTLSERQCSSKADPQELPTSAKLFLWYLLLRTAVSIGATVYHPVIIEAKSCCQGWNFWEVLSGFSVIQSVRSLTRTSGDKNGNILNGLKFISIVYVIVGHRLHLTLGSVISNPQDIEPIYDWGNGSVISGIVVENFLVISGFLVFWIMYPYFKESGAGSIRSFIVYSWLRIMPLYMSVIAFVALVFPYIEEGPIWKSLVYREVERCQENWWTNLLAIQNYVNSEKICLIHGWYVACHIHLSVLGAFIVYTFSRSRSFGLKILLTCMLVSWAIPFMDTYLNDHDAIMRFSSRLMSNPTTDRYYRDFYIKSHNKAGPYLVGILTGYLVMVFKESKLKVSMRIRWIIFIIILFISVGSQMYTWNFYDRTRETSSLEKGLFAALSRSLGSLLLAFIILCQYVWGLGTAVKYILMHDFYMPIGRLTFAAYLVHPFIQLLTTATIRSPIYFTTWRMYWMGAGDIIISYVIAFWLYCIIEAPATNLFNMLMNTKSIKKMTRHDKEAIVPAMGMKTGKEISVSKDNDRSDQPKKTTHLSNDDSSSCSENKNGQ